MQTDPSPPRDRRSPRAVVARLFKSLLLSSTEMALAVALVLVFAGVFLGILVVAFPKGTGLVSFYGDLVESRGPSARLQVQRTAGDDEFVAVLSDVQRQVRDRPAAAITWNKARRGMPLEDQHTIQTLDRSTAAIEFGDRAKLHLAERSLVVVKQQDPTTGLRSRKASIVLLGGQVDGVLEPGQGASARLDIVTTGGTSAVKADREAGAEFSVAMTDDQSSLLSVFTGIAELRTADGAVRIGPREAVSFDASGAMSAPTPIPEPPRSVAPADGQVFAFGAVAPRVRFVWQGDADVYRLVVARDRAFTEIVYRGEVADDHFVHGNLPVGASYWRVSSVVDGVASRPGPVRALRLEQDLIAPELRVDLPGDVVTEQRLVIRGVTEPDGELYVDDRIVPLDPAGSFELTVELQRGLNMIVVEAIDPAGNSTYQSGYVTARF